jgi:4,5-dihydroxyphthalate decarboxylase
VFVRADSPIREPADLAGKRFGLPEYQMTAAVWVRGVLQHEFGVAPSKIRWFVERSRSLSHGGQTGFKAPKGVSIEHVPKGGTLFSRLVGGELDAVMPSPYPGMRSMLNKTDLFALGRSPHVRLLFDDPIAEGARSFRKHGFSHINHTVVVHDRILKKQPWVALNLFKAFTEAKQQSYARMDSLLRSNVMGAFGVLDAQRRTFGDDPFSYGLGGNRTALQTVADYAFEQGLLRKPAAIDDIFAAATRDV